MKRLEVIISLLVLIVMLSSCSLPIKKPTGTWKSNDSKIVINFSEDESGENAGTFELNGEIKKIIWAFDYGSNLTILDISAIDEEGSIHTDNYYFIARYKYRNDKFTLTVISSKVEDYPEKTEIEFTKE